MLCKRCSGAMYEEKFILGGDHLVDYACPLCGNRDSEDIRKNRAEAKVNIKTHKKVGRPIGPCGAYKRNIEQSQL